MTTAQLVGNEVFAPVEKSWGRSTAAEALRGDSRISRKSERMERA